MQSTLSVYAHIVVSIVNEGHKSLSALAVTIILWMFLDATVALAVTLIYLEVAECRLIFLDSGWPDELGSLVIRG
jgi:hypothetical protein